MGLARVTGSVPRVCRPPLLSRLAKVGASPGYGRDTREQAGRREVSHGLGWDLTCSNSHPILWAEAVHVAEHRVQGKRNGLHSFGARS